MRSVCVPGDETMKRVQSALFVLLLLALGLPASAQGMVIPCDTDHDMTFAYPLR